MPTTKSLRSFGLWASAGLALCLPPMSAARADSCSELWYSRNSIYKEQGYCFHTSRGIRAFGNAGCQYDDVESVPLSAYQHRVIAGIVGQERDQGCRD